MTREEYTQEILELSDSHKALMLHLPTGFGKSKIAIDIMTKHLGDKIMGCNVLIVVPKLVLMDNWKAELQKWGFPQHIHIAMSTYVSYPKHTEEFWDMIILDEAHHFTEACEEATYDMHYDRVLAMSATIPKEPRWRLKESFEGIYEYRVSARDAINDEILPDPKILLIPMMLDNTRVDQTIIIRKSKPGTPVELTFQQRGQRFHYPTKRVHIHCTQQQYYNFISTDIDRKKEDYFRTQEVFRKNQWLMACKQRLDWMTTLKEDFVLELLKMLEGTKMEVPVGATSKNPMVPTTQMDTSNILFICGGAFPEMEGIIRERLNKASGIGFAGELKVTEGGTDDENILTKANMDDLRKFGMIPEFLGRLPVLVTLETLNRDYLVRILKEPKMPS